MPSVNSTAMPILPIARI